MNPIETLRNYASETLGYWEHDQDSKVGKRLKAMAGEMPGYSAEVDAALNAAAILTSSANRIWPAALTPELAEVIGMPCFQCGNLADIHRLGGAEIAHKAEAEQAYVLHWLVGLLMEHGPEWRQRANEQMKLIVDAETARREAEGAKAP